MMSIRGTIRSRVVPLRGLRQVEQVTVSSTEVGAIHAKVLCPWRTKITW
jgi:hypothetical protein